jgi:hypothetical protein
LENENMEIILKYASKGAGFNSDYLVSLFINEKLDYITIGATHVSLLNHPKPKSLDVWIRNLESVTMNHKDTCQAVATVINQLISLENFSLAIRKCRTSGKMCKVLLYHNKN